MPNVVRKLIPNSPCFIQVVLQGIQFLASPELCVFKLAQYFSK